MKYVKVQIINKSTIELLEDAKKGEKINLDLINQVDQTNILNTITTNQKLAWEKELSAQFINQQNELIKNFEIEIIKLKTMLNDKEQALLLKTKLELQNQFQKQIENYINEINKLKLTNKELEITNQKQLESSLKLQRNEFEEKINQQNLTIEKLKIQQARSSIWAVTKKGNELEKWCENQYESYADSFENCQFTRYKTEINLLDENDFPNEKADYIFSFFGEKTNKIPFLSICCEMKSEFNDSKHKSKNKDHINKLVRDAKRANCKYAFLISELELETENDIQVRLMPTLESGVEVYLVRPMFFILMLKLFYKLAKKLFALNRFQSVELIDKNKLNEQFKQLKDNFLTKTFLEIEKVCKSNLVDIETLEKAVVKLRVRNERVLDQLLNKWTKKIDSFDLQLTKKITNNY